MAQSSRSVDGKLHTGNSPGQKVVQPFKPAATNPTLLITSPGTVSAIETRSRGLRYGVEAKFSPRPVSRKSDIETRTSPTTPRNIRTPVSKSISSRLSTNSNHSNGTTRSTSNTVRSTPSTRNGINTARNAIRRVLDYSSTKDSPVQISYRAAQKLDRHAKPISLTGLLNDATAVQKDSLVTSTSRASHPVEVEVVRETPSIQINSKPSASSTSDGSEWSNSEEESILPKVVKGAKVAKTTSSAIQTLEESLNKTVPRHPLRELSDKPQLKPVDQHLHPQLSAGSKLREAKSLRQQISAKISLESNSLALSEHNQSSDTTTTKLAQKTVSSTSTDLKTSPTSNAAKRLRVPLNQRKVQREMEYEAAIRAGIRSHPTEADLGPNGSTSMFHLPQTAEAKDFVKPEHTVNHAKNSKLPSRPRQVLTLSVPEYEENLRYHISQMRGDQSYYTKNKIQSARASLSSMNPKFTLAKSPFEGIASVKCDTTIKQNVGKFGHFVKGTNEKSNNLVAYHTTSYEQGQPSIPPYTTYIPAKRNILTEDDRQRTFLPYHGDDFEVDDTDKEYAALETKIEENQNRYHQLNKLNDLSRMHFRYAEQFLSDIGCDIESVLQYLLDEEDPSPSSALPHEYLPYWGLRTSYLQEGYYEEEDDQDALERQDTPYQTTPRPQWKQLFDQLPKAGDEKLAIACLACKVFRDVAGFSLFHIVQNFNPTVEVTFQPFSLGTYVELACFICKAHECLGHGEYHDTDQGKNTRERVNFKPGTPDAETPPTYRINDTGVTDLLGLRDDGEIVGAPWTTFRESSSPGFSDAELCHDDCFWAKQARVTELSIWHREDEMAFRMLRPAYEFERRGPCLIAQCGLIRKSCKEIFLKLLTEPSKHNEHSLKIRNALDSATTVFPPRKTVDQWFDDPKSENAWRQDQREPFVPCDHTGPCSELTTCSCYWEGVHCEKSCACADKCSRRFQGCRCHAKGKPCRTDKCECKRFNRECDPDLCISCEADEVLDPANRHNEDAIAGKCNNVAIQRGVPKRTLLGPSKLMADGGKSGWGLYMGEECKKGDFIGEYRGEIISEAEADQRGTIYDKRNLSYLFGLNGAQLLDSTLIGNKLRFINHQAEPWANCFAKLLLCNGVVRIGMFAQKDIAISEEMFFNYGENFATKFDLIKMNADGSVTVERPQKGSKPREVFKRRLAPEMRNSHYQLKNKISKNGQRLGRPPKSAEKSHLPSLASGTSTVSHKRFRSEVSDEPEYRIAFSGKGSESESEISRRNTRRKRLRRSPSDLNNDMSSDTPIMHRKHRLRGTRQGVTQSSQASSTQSPSSQRDYRIITRTQSKSQSIQRDLSVSTPSPNHRKARSALSQNQRLLGDEDSAVEEGEAEEDDLTPRRSSRRRQGKQHFDDAGSSASTPSRVVKRTPRKELGGL